MLARLNALIERRWLAVVFFLWLVFANIAIFFSLEPVIELGLRDTDDNLRLVQVRDWLAGQGWYDLEQHRMVAGNLHWSRIVDLPIAGMIKLFEPFTGMATAERLAVMMAPLLAMLATLIGLGLTVRRVVGPRAAPLMAVALIFSPMVAATFWPLRIDHHNWQLASLAFVMAGAVDPKRRRGGIVAGVASALSLGIGLEMLIPLALVGAGLVLGWVWRREEAPRVAAYGASLALGCALVFAAFASEANRALVCDVLSPVWLTDMMLAGGLAVLLAWRSPEAWRARLVLAGAAGVVLGAVHGVAFPQCLSRLEGVDPAVADLWLDRVMEARGLQRHSAATAVRALGPVLVGLAGFALGWFLLPKDGERRRRLLIVAVPTLVLGALMFWQLRSGTAAQGIAVVGAAMLVALLVPRAQASGSVLVRVVGTVAILLVGLNVPWLMASSAVPKNASEQAKRAVDKEQRAAGKSDSAKCKDAFVMGQLDVLPPATLFAHIDLGPRLLATTHHTVITGPYHRNDEAIGWVISAMEAPPSRDAEAERTVRGLGADYVFVCNDAEPARAATRPWLEKRLRRGEAPDWLEPADPRFDGLPFKLFRVRPAATG